MHQTPPDTTRHAPDNVWLVGSGPVMIYRAIQLIQIFCAHGRTDGRTNEANPRGPRGPKKIDMWILLVSITCSCTCLTPVILSMTIMIMIRRMTKMMPMMALIMIVYDDDEEAAYIFILWRKQKRARGKMWTPSQKNMAALILYGNECFCIFLTSNSKDFRFLYFRLWTLDFSLFKLWRKNHAAFLFHFAFFNDGAKFDDILNVLFHSIFFLSGMFQASILKHLYHIIIMPLVWFSLIFLVWTNISLPNCPKLKLPLLKTEGHFGWEYDEYDSQIDL